MKLQELSAPSPSKQIAKVFESYFGSRIRFDQLNARQARTMLHKVRGVLGEHRKTSARHHSEKNPQYLQLLMMEQALSTKVAENIAPVSTAMPSGQTATASAGAAKPMAGAVKAAVKDPKLSAALKKSAAGQTLNPEEQKLVAGAAMMQAESRFRRLSKVLSESEVQQAQVVLAAQDMVDKMQGMLEDVSELQFKELPALVDSIKNQVGMDQATQFNTDATAALSGLLQNIQGAKQQLDAALGVVTGQAPQMPDVGAMPAPGADMAAAGADIAAAGGEADAGMADLDAAAAAAAEPEAEPAAGALGRAKR